MSLGRRTQRAGLIAAPLALLLLWFAPTHEDPAARHAVAIASLMIILWATEAISPPVAGVLGLLLFWTLGASSFTSAFSGFVSETAAFLLGALLIGAMAGKAGLPRRIAYTIASRVGSSYSRLLLAFIVADFLLTFLIPSGIARVTVLTTAAAGVIQALGLGPRSNAARGLMIVVTYTAAIFDKMIIAGTSSILARGIIEQVGQVRVLYSQWFIAYLPCDAVTILCGWRLILWLYPPEQEHLGGGAEFLRAELARMGPYSPAEKRCAALLAGAVVLWMTDFVHGIAPSAIAVGAGLIALLPPVGLLTARDLGRLHLRAVAFTATALGMSRVLADTGGLEVLTRAMVGWMHPLVTGPFTASVVLYWTAFIYHLFLGNPAAMLSTSLPVVLEFSREQGLAALPVGMIWTFAAGGKIFAYQSAVLMVGYSSGYFEARDLLKVGLVFTILESLVLLLLVPFYWPLIGVR
jgi:anion transporter